MFLELREKIGNMFVEEQIRTVGVYKLQDGDLVSELILAGQLSADVNPQNRVAEFEVVERRVKPFGVWKPLSAKEPVFLTTNE